MSIMQKDKIKQIKEHIVNKDYFKEKSLALFLFKIQL